MRLVELRCRNAAEAEARTQFLRRLGITVECGATANAAIHGSAYCIRVPDWVAAIFTSARLLEHGKYTMVERYAALGYADVQEAIQALCMAGDMAGALRLIDQFNEYQKEVLRDTATGTRRYAPTDRQGRLPAQRPGGAHRGPGARPTFDARRDARVEARLQNGRHEPSARVRKANLAGDRRGP